MTKNETESMTKSELAKVKALFGQSPVLSSEDAKNFEEILDRVIACLGPKNIVEFIYMRHFVCASWLIDRYTRHGALAVERRVQVSREYQAARMKLRTARREDVVSKSAQPLNQSPADIAHLVKLEDKVLESISDVDEALDRATREFEHSRALEQSVAFQEQLNTLIMSQTVIRNDAIRQLELFRVGLGLLVSTATRETIDAEYHEITDQPEQSAALSIVPSQ